MKLGRHESVAVAWVDKADEVDSEHGHIESDGDDDEAEETGEKVFEPDTLAGVSFGGPRRLDDAFLKYTHRSDVASIGKNDPQLESSKTADPGNGEEPNPFHTDGSAETKTSE